MRKPILAVAASAALSALTAAAAAAAPAPAPATADLAALSRIPAVSGYEQTLAAALRRGS